MLKFNWPRLMMAGLIATIICFLTDGLIHEKVLGDDWHAVYAALGAREPEPHGPSMFYFILFDIGRGFGAMFLYALMRPFHGPGPKTAVIAAIASWLLTSVTTPAQFIPLGFITNALWLKAAGLQLVTSIVAALVGAWLYRGPADEKTA